MYIRYAYGGISTNSTTARAQISHILDDIVAIATYTGTTGLTSADYLSSLGAQFDQSIFDPELSIIKVARLPTWELTANSSSTDTVKYLTSIGSDETKIKNIIIASGTVTASSANPADSAKACTLNIKAYERQDVNGNTVDHYATGYGSSLYKQPIIYSRGGYLYISVTNNQFLIASMNRATTSWNPGIGVMDFEPISNTYHMAGYPNWVYISMYSLSTMSLPRMYDVSGGVDISNNGSTDSVYNQRMQIMSPYVTSSYNDAITSVSALTKTYIPKYTYNANLTRGLNIARFKIHGTPGTSLYYDVGGDVSTACGTYIITNGDNMDSINILPANQDVYTTSLEASYYYGEYILWTAGILPGGISNTKFLIKVG